MKSKPIWLRVSSSILVMCSVGLVCLTGVKSSASTIEYNTIPAWVGEGVAALGGNGVSAYGQTFVVPATAPRLDSFTFVIGEFLDGPPVPYRAYVAQWDGALKHPTGSILFESDVRKSTDTGWTQTTIDTGGLTLTPGVSYIAFLGTFGLFSSLEEQLKGAIIGSNPYADGQFFYFGDNATTAQLDSIFLKKWQLPIGGSGTPETQDLAFRMSFSVPEPTSLTLLLSAGMCLLAASRQWRRRKHAQDDASQQRSDYGNRSRPSQQPT